MTAERPARESAWWVGHPVVKIPATIIGLAYLVSVAVFDGRQETLVATPFLALLTVGLSVVPILILTGHAPMRATRLKWMSPVTLSLFGCAWFVGSMSMWLGALHNPFEDEEPPGNAGVGIAVALGVLAVAVQLASFTAWWPDWLKPPYARRHREAPSPEAPP